MYIILYNTRAEYFLSKHSEKTTEFCLKHVYQAIETFLKYRAFKLNTLTSVYSHFLQLSVKVSREVEHYN